VEKLGERGWTKSEGLKGLDLDLGTCGLASKIEALALRVNALVLASRFCT